MQSVRKEKGPRSVDRSFVAHNTAARERLHALAGRLGDDALGRSLDGGWTVAAALAHLAFWDRRALVLLERWARDGVGPSPADAEALNEALLPQWLALPARAAAQGALDAADAVDRALEVASPEVLAAVAAPARAIALLRAEHRGEHVDQIERVLAG